MAEQARGDKAEAKIKEALRVLEALGFPRQQINERSALTLLAILALKPGQAWSSASDPLMGITPMMEFFAEHYGKRYAPNTRETVRRQTVHQFVQSGLVILNPDLPTRSTNSPKAVYQIEPSALKLLRVFGKRSWKALVTEYLGSTETLNLRFAREREMGRTPLELQTGEKIRLSPGAHNALVKSIIEDFCPLYTPGARIVYVGDTERKWAYYDSETLLRLGVAVDAHGKMPDVVVHFTARGWLVLVEAVTSHGPVSPKRRQELRDLFAGISVGIVYVTAFPDKRTMTKYLNDISWETEVWIADAPTHLIHFNGERFLGPYD